MRRLARTLALLAALALPRAASAQPAPPPGPASTGAPAVPRAVPAVAHLAAALAASLPAAPGPSRLAVAPLVSDVPAPRADELALLVAAQLGGRAGLAAPSEPTSLASAIASARGAARVVYVRPRVAAGRLSATVDVHPVPRTAWARIRDPEPGSIAHGFAEAAIDAEVRAHLAPVPLVGLDARRAQNSESGVIALACEDLDRDGAPEIVSVSRLRVTLLRVRGDRVEVVRARPWHELSPVDPTPLREPIASAFALPVSPDAPSSPREVVVSITDRRDALRLGATLDTVATFPGHAIPEGGRHACSRLVATTVTGPLEPCEPGIAPRRASVGGRYDAFAAAPLVDARGAPFEVWIGREDGALEIRDDAGHLARLPSVGAQLAVGDLDQDGRPEILASRDVARAADDGVLVATWERDGRPPRKVLDMPVAAGVQALAVCPPDGRGRAAFVVATAADVLVVR